MHIAELRISTILSSLTTGIQGQMLKNHWSALKIYLLGQIT